MPWPQRHVGARDVVSRRRGRSRHRQMCSSAKVTPSGKVPITFPGRLGRTPTLPHGGSRMQSGRDRDPQQQHRHWWRTTATARLPQACFMSNPTQGQHTIGRWTCRRTASSRLPLVRTCTERRPCSPSATDSHTRSSLLESDRDAARPVDDGCRSRLRIRLREGRRGAGRFTSLPCLAAGAEWPSVPSPGSSGLAPSGPDEHVTIHVARRAFQFWSIADHAWRTAWGNGEIAVGASAGRDLRLRTTAAPLSRLPRGARLSRRSRTSGRGTGLHAKAKAARPKIAADPKLER